MIEQHSCAMAGARGSATFLREAWPSCRLLPVASDQRARSGLLAMGSRGRPSGVACLAPPQGSPTAGSRAG